MKPIVTTFLFVATMFVANLHAEEKRPNVLMIAIDDLNHWVGHLGRNPQTKTPNIDRLAEEGTSFSRAYCAAPACNPSRAALMSGMRPSTTGCYLNSQDWHPGISEDKLLNTQFFKAGYRVYGCGKIYHSSVRGGDWHDYFNGKDSTTIHPDAKDQGVGGIAFYPLANSDEEMPDYKVVNFGIEKLNEKSDKPFFLAVGLVKPHMPFSVPKKWYDMFPLESIELPPHREDDLNDVPPSGVKMAGPDGDHANIIQSGRWKEAVQAYLATVAFCDSQVGRILDALEKSPHRDNTIVCLWSDHGWSLGEKSHWRKFALWEEPTRTVFVWKVPGMTKANTVCGRTVDFSSVYPTLCELSGLPLPSHLDGKSLVPLLRDANTTWPYAAVTTHGFKNHTVRTEDWRYIRYANGEEELYNETSDPLEYTNLAVDAKYASTIEQLARHLPGSDAANLPSAEGGKGKGNGKVKKRAKQQR